MRWASCGRFRLLQFRRNGSQFARLRGEVWVLCGSSRNGNRARWSFIYCRRDGGERMWWSAVVYQLKHRLLTTRKAGVWLSIGPSTLNGNKICTATVLATIFYVTFCLGASCLRLDLHCILTAVPQTPNNPAPMTQIILHQPHRTPKKLLPLISVCPLIYCPLKLEET